jgi:hypothetical protein
MGFCLSARDHPGTLVSICPYQNNYSPVQESQANQSFFAIGFASIFAGEHRPIKKGLAFSQVNLVLVLVAFSFAGVVGHENYRICIY